MKDLSGLVPRVHAVLAPEAVRGWISGDFVDRPESMRSGVLGGSDSRLVFHRRRLRGDEVLVRPLTDVSDASVGAFGDMVMPDGARIPEVQIRFADGVTWRMTMFK